MSTVFGRVGAAVGLAVAGVAAGTAVTAVAQRNAARRIMRRPDPEAGEDLIESFGRVRTIRTDDGVHLSVEVIEPANPIDALTVVFVHGYALDRTTWHYQARDLRDLGRLVLFDLRGHGRSEPGDSEGYTIDRLARDLDEVIRATAPDGPIVLIGHSMGGMTILALAERNPEWFGDRVVGVGLLASAADVGNNELAIAGPIGRLVHRVGPGIAGIIGDHPWVLDRGLKMGDDLVVILTQRYGFGSDAPPSLVRHTKAMHASTPVDVLVGLLPAFAELDLDDVLPVLKRVESTVVVGEDDVMAPPGLSKAIAEQLPGSEYLVLANTGHMLMLERYPEVNQHIRDLIKRVRRGLRAA